MKFPTMIYQDEDGAWIVECPAIPGCVSQGQTRDEAMENIKEAIALCLEVRAERGCRSLSKLQTSKLRCRRNRQRKKLPSPSANAEMNGAVDLLVDA